MSLREHPEVTDFIAYLHLKNFSPATIAGYHRTLKRLFAHVGLAESAPSEITAAQLRDYVAHLQKRGLAANTVANYVLAIKRFFGFLLAEGYIEEDPSRRLPRPKVGKRLPKALTIPEVQALFAAMSDETATGRRDQVFFKLLYACGLRIGEAVRVRVADINWEEGWLRVVGKGNKERRVYLKPYLLAGLRAYVEENGLEGYLFPGGAEHITVQNMRRQLKKYLGKAGLPRHITPHTLRHSIAVRYLMGGAPITFVQGLLGHESRDNGDLYPIGGSDGQGDHPEHEDGPRWNRRGGEVIERSERFLRTGIRRVGCLCEPGSGKARASLKRHSCLSSNDNGFINA